MHNQTNINFDKICNGSLISSNTCPNISNRNYTKIISQHIPQLQHTNNHCEGYLSDKQFLEHMIPHHQVAIDMGKNVLGSTTNQEIGWLCKKIIHNQYEEIIFMHTILENFIPDMSSNKKQNIEYITNNTEHWFPKAVTDENAKCNAKSYHMAHKVTPGDIAVNDFLVHMIPHHQIAVDMSKRLLRYTDNPMLMKLGYDIVKDQQWEIWYMKGMLQSYKKKK